MDKDMRIIAEKYFAGRIDRHEEKLLFDYISDDRQHEEQFRLWETEYYTENPTSDETEEQWQRLHKRIIQDRPSSSPLLVSLRSWRAVAAAAVVLLFVGLGWAWMRQPKEEFYTCTAPVGSRTELTLPDGSKVILNAKTTLRYSSLFNLRNRNVELDGQAYFEVAKQKGNTFTVRTRNCDVVVKGTKFDVEAYDNEQLTQTQLYEGSVEINGKDTTVLLKPGDCALLDNASGRVTVTRQDQEAAWNAGTLLYENITLSRLSRVLERQYGVDVHLGDKADRNAHFSVTLHADQTIDEVMAALARITGSHVSRHGKDVYID